MKNNIKPNSDWETKFLRENWTLQFGSLCNIYAQTNQNKGIPIEKILEDTSKLFEKAMEFGCEALKRSQISREEEVIDYSEDKL